MTWIDLLPKLPHECELPAVIPLARRVPGALWRCSCNRLWVLGWDTDGPGMSWRWAGWRLRRKYRRHGIWRNGIRPITLTPAPWDKPPADFDG